MIFKNGFILRSDCPVGNQQSGFPLRTTNDHFESIKTRKTGLARATLYKWVSIGLYARECSDSRLGQVRSALRPGTARVAQLSDHAGGIV
jgi:hypothetical protein